MASRAKNVLVGAASSRPEDHSREHSSGILVCEAPSSRDITASIIRLTNASPELHEHPAAQVSFLFSGASAVLLAIDATGAVTHTPFHPGSIAYIAPEKSHRVQWHGTGEMLNLYFPESFGRELTEQTGFELPYTSGLQPADPGLRGISQVIREEFSWAEGISNAIIDHARLLMATRLIRSLNYESTRAAVGLLDIQRLQPAVDALNAFPEKPFSLAELARLCNSSVFHFARSFTARIGTPPYAYQRTLRLEKARSLLQTNGSLDRSYRV